MCRLEQACADVQQHLPKHTAISFSFNQHVTAGQYAEDFYDPRYWISDQEEVKAFEENSFWSLCYTVDEDAQIFRMYLASDLNEAISYALVHDCLPSTVVH